MAPSSSMPEVLAAGGMDGKSLTLRQRLSTLTWPVALIAIYTSLAMFNYGYDVLVFSGIVAMPDFIKRFGTCSSTLDGEETCQIPGEIVSIMNSMPWLGKIAGTWLAAPLAERFGRRPVFLVIIGSSVVGVLLQITAVEVAQFTVGRVICYGMTGLCVLVIPAYVGETAPAALRGLLIAQMQIQITFSQLCASLVNLGTKTIPGKASWMIPIGIQFVVPLALAVLYPFIIESPRWLISKGRHSEALASLRKLRGAGGSDNDDNDENNAMEAELVAEMDSLHHMNENTETGSWKELWQGTNKRRTIISIIAMLGQQVTGQAFFGQYGVIFYEQQGFDNSFELQAYQMVLSLGTTLFTSVVVDSFGRRPLLLVGGLSQAVFLFLVGGTGTISDPGREIQRLMVASFFLFGASFALSWAPLSYVTLSEASSRRLVEKTNLVAVTISVVAAFVVSFTVPYLLYPQYAGLGARVGFIYGGCAIIMCVLAFFLIPEMKGRSLEELEVLYQRETPTRKFKGAVVALEEVGVAAQKIDDVLAGDAESVKGAGATATAVQHLSRTQSRDNVV